MDDSGLAFLDGGGRCGALMRTLDWSASPLGHPSDWPQSLRTVTGLLLNSRFPMFVAWGPELGFLYNDGYAEILGVKHPDAMGRRFHDNWPEIWDDIHPLIERALAGEATWHENLPLTMHRHGFDEPTWFTFSYSPVRDESGRVAGMYCACTETTAQVLAERYRAEQNERFRAMFEQAPGIMALLRGPTHVFELANPAYLQLVGLRNVLGKTVRDALPDVADQGFFELLDRVYRTGEPFIGYALPLTLQRGPDSPPEERFVDFVYQPIRGADGKVEGIFAEGSDVTERILALRELQASDRRKDEFLAMLAHELRNPLSPISSAAQLLQREPDNANVVRRASEIVARQAAHMTKLVDDLLDVSRVTRRRVTLDRQPLDLGRLVASAVEQVRGDIESRAHRLEVKLPTAPAWVNADRTRMVQVIANLLGNAAKFSDDGGRIVLTVVAGGDDVRLSVRDEGIGIAREQLPVVFELFMQADVTPDRAKGGLGLGLALVRSLVELHGGRVEARSDGPGRGSEFIVVLPRSEAPEAGDRPAAETRGDCASELHILVLDDNVDAARTLALLLRTDGHRVDVEHDAETAYARAVSETPQVMVLDIGLPVLDGYQLARRLRATPETANVTLIALTGYGQPLDLRRSAAAGFDHHLIKPVDIDALNALLRQAAPA